MESNELVSFSAKEVFSDIRSYLAGRFVGSTRDEFFLEEIVKLVFCKYEFLRDDSLYSPSEVSHSYRSCFRALTSAYPDIFVEGSEIELDTPSIEYVDEHLSRLNLTSLERDVMGDAYETFMGSAVKGQFGQFFTPQNAANLLVNMVSPKPDETVLDLACGAGGFLATAASYIQDHYPETDMEKYVEENVYGVDKDSYLSRLAKIRLASLFSSVGDIKCADSLVWNESLLGAGKNRFDVILTNPPFGSNISAGSEETLRKYTLARKYRSRNDQYVMQESINLSIPPQVVFLEQCFNLLKPNGRLGIVVPESMISSKKYGYVSNYLLEETTIEAIIGMPESLFKTSGKGGTHTKTCLLLLKKSEPSSKDQSFFAAEAKWCGHDSRGRLIPNDDLPTIWEKYVAHVSGELEEDGELGCFVSLNDYKGMILAPRSFTGTIGVSIEDKKDEYDFFTIGELIDGGVLSVSTGDEVGKLEYGTGDVPFIRTSDISNWRVSSDSKHKISEASYEALCEKQDVQVGDLLMVKDGGYLIGNCALITELDTHIVYQSHIFKFRVNKNDLGLTPEYLLAVLSSRYLRAQIEAKTCTLDIINSLGNRHRDLMIPIPKDRRVFSKIHESVSNSIARNVESRKLAEQAMTAVELLECKSTVSTK